MDNPDESIQRCMVIFLILAHLLEGNSSVKIMLKISEETWGSDRASTCCIHCYVHALH